MHKIYSIFKDKSLCDELSQGLFCIEKQEKGMENGKLHYQTRILSKEKG